MTERTDQQAAEIVDQMMSTDAFSRWLGVTIDQVRVGFSQISMMVRDEMVNGFGVCHGGITFALADSAFAFASNGRGRLSLALEANISYPNPVHVGDCITATATECSVSNRVATYQVQIVNQAKLVVGLFRGTVYRTSKTFSENEIQEEESS